MGFLDSFYFTINSMPPNIFVSKLLMSLAFIFEFFGLPESLILQHGQFIMLNFPRVFAKFKATSGYMKQQHVEHFNWPDAYLPPLGRLCALKRIHRPLQLID